MKDTVVANEMKTAIGELAAAEAAEAALRDELKPLVEEKVAALMDGKQLTAPKERKISLVRARLDEATEIAQAKRQHVRQLHLLVVNKDVEAGRLRQREFVAEVTRESEKVAPLLRELEATRRRIAD